MFYIHTKIVIFVTQQKINIMVSEDTRLVPVSPVIKIAGTFVEVTRMFLRVFLAKERLTEKQLDVTTALVTRYSEYISNGVAEPYASLILFSSDSRKAIVTELKISPAHLNNTFNSLTEKNILVKEKKVYAINPGLVPTEALTFKFEVKR